MHNTFSLKKFPKTNLLLIPLISLMVSLLLTGCKKPSTTLETKIIVEPIPFSHKPYHLFRGVLESNRSTPVNSSFSSSITSLIPNGSIVKKGEVMIELDDQEIKEKIREKIEEIENEKLELEKEKLEKELKKKNRGRRVEIRRLQWKLAEIQLEQFQRGVDYPNLLEASMKDPHLDLEISSLEEGIKESRVLVERGFSNESEINQLQVDLIKKNNEKKINRSRFRHLRGYKNPLTLLDLQEKAIKTRSDYLDSDKSGEVEEKSAELSYLKKSRTLLDLERELKELEKNQSHCKILAPRDGAFFYGKTWITEGDRERIQIGHPVWEGWEVGYLIDPENLKCDILVSERDLHYFQEGLELSFTLDGLPQNKFKAVVSKLRASGSLSENHLNPLALIPIEARVLEKSDHLILGRGVNIWVQGEEQVGFLLPSLKNLPHNRLIGTKGESFQFEILANIPPFQLISAPLKEGQGLEISENSNFEKFLLKGGNIQLEIKDLGELVPKIQSLLRVSFGGKIESLEAEGESLKKGERVAVIETNELGKKLQGLEIDARSLEKELEEEKIEGENGKNSRLKEIKNQQLILKMAQIEEKITHKNLDPRELAIQKVNLQQLSLDIQQAEKEFKEKKALGKKGYSSQKEIQDLSIRQSALKIALAKLEARQELERSGPTSLEKAKKETQVIKEKLELVQKENELEIQNQIYQISQKMKSSKLLRTRKRIKKIQENIAEGKVLSPHDGVVLHLKQWTGNGLKSIQAGDTTRSRMGFAKVAVLEDFFLEGSIREEFRPFIQKGCQVTFQLGEQSNSQFKGEVFEIGLKGEKKEEKQKGFFGGGDSPEIPAESQRFEIKIAVLDKNPSFQPGKSAQFVIKSIPFPNGCRIPGQFIFPWKEKFWVFPVKGEPFPIEIAGKTGNEFIAVLQENSGETQIEPPSSRHLKWLMQKESL